MSSSPKTGRPKSGVRSPGGRQERPSGSKAAAASEGQGAIEEWNLTARDIEAKTPLISETRDTDVSMFCIQDLGVKPPPSAGWVQQDENDFEGWWVNTETEDWIYHCSEEKFFHLPSSSLWERRETDCCDPCASPHTYYRTDMRALQALQQFAGSMDSGLVPLVWKAWVRYVRKMRNRASAETSPKTSGDMAGMIAARARSTSKLGSNKDDGTSSPKTRGTRKKPNPEAEQKKANPEPVPKSKSPPAIATPEVAPRMPGSKAEPEEAEALAPGSGGEASPGGPQVSQEAEPAGPAIAHLDDDHLFESPKIPRKKGDANRDDAPDDARQGGRHSILPEDIQLEEEDQMINVPLVAQQPETTNAIREDANLQSGSTTPGDASLSEGSSATPKGRCSCFGRRRPKGGSPKTAAADKNGSKKAKDKNVSIKEEETAAPPQNSAPSPPADHQRKLLLRAGSQALITETTFDNGRTMIHATAIKRSQVDVVAQAVIQQAEEEFAKSARSGASVQMEQSFSQSDRHKLRLEQFLMEVHKNPQKLSEHVERRRLEKSQYAFMIL